MYGIMVPYCSDAFRCPLGGLYYAFTPKDGSIMVYHGEFYTITLFVTTPARSGGLVFKM